MSGAEGAGSTPGDGAPWSCDLGCGPGHTTAMLRRRLARGVVVGDRRLARLRGRGPGAASRRCWFVRGRRQLCAAARCGPRRLVYARFLLVHLPDPAASGAGLGGVAVAWGGAGGRGARAHRHRGRRLPSLPGTGRRRGGGRGADLYAGRHLHGVAWPPGWECRSWTAMAALEVSMGDAAGIFVRNLRHWAHDPFAGGLTDTDRARLPGVTPRCPARRRPPRRHPLAHAPGRHGPSRMTCT